jgi:hypothetical protein
MLKVFPVGSPVWSGAPAQSEGPLQALVYSADHKQTAQIQQLILPAALLAEHCRALWILEPVIEPSSFAGQPGSATIAATLKQALAFPSSALRRTHGFRSKSGKAFVRVARDNPQMSLSPGTQVPDFRGLHPIALRAHKEALLSRLVPPLCPHSNAVLFLSTLKFIDETLLVIGPGSSIKLDKILFTPDQKAKTFVPKL